MGEPTAYLNGRFVPYSQAVLPFHDAGFVSGATLTDFARTFGRRLFRFGDHLRRLRRDCEACHVPLAAADAELEAAAAELVARNAAVLPPGGELALVTFATPGPLGHMAGTADGPPTVGMHTFPLPLARYRPFFESGARLVVAGAAGTFAGVLPPPGVKHRSRMHWWVADRRVRAAGHPPGSLALLLDQDGCVTETALASVLAVIDGVVTSPPRGHVLDGLSLGFVRELCETLVLPFAERPLHLGECRGAAELVLAGSGFCVAGVCEVDGTPLPWPGPVTRRLLAAWSDAVGLDVEAQIRGG